tara:strand:+ start:318 stop:518 length:201 start_codon:yes stop_codon:yes gene_type:complete
VGVSILLVAVGLFSLFTMAVVVAVVVWWCGGVVVWWWCGGGRLVVACSPCLLRTLALLWHKVKLKE